jgi:hypothetical protein
MSKKLKSAPVFRSEAADGQDGGAASVLAGCVFKGFAHRRLNRHRRRRTRSRVPDVLLAMEDEQ